MPPLVSATDRSMAVQTRGDLTIVPVQFAHERSYLVSDPVTLENFQLTSAERFLLEKLRRPISLAALQAALQRDFPGQQATLAQLQQFVDRLYQQRLLISTLPGQGNSLCEQRRLRQRQQRLTALLSWLAVRMGGIAAGPWIDRLYGMMRWVFSPLGWLGAGCLALYAMNILMARGGEFFADAKGALASPWEYGVVPWIVALVGVKCVHELGHALTCRHFGGECREIGLLLLAGMPTLYCDVSDVWRLPDKWRRIAVASGGMAAELGIAMVSLVVWNQASSGALASFCCNLAIVCSVGTLLVNANPLLRYDGYYVLSDLSETPNLADRSRALVRNGWRRWFLGEPMRDDPWLSAPKRRALMVYAVASTLYLWLLLGGMAVGLVLWARPQGWESLALLLLASLLLAGVVRRALAMATWLKNPAVRARLRWFRLALTLACVALAGTVAWHWPVARRVVMPYALAAEGGIPIVAPVSGRLEYAARPGSQLNQGDVVVRLVDPLVELTIARQEAALRQAELRCRQLNALRPQFADASHELPAALAQREALHEEAAEWNARGALLAIQAPATGRLLAAPLRLNEARDGDALTTWAGDPLADRNYGAWIEEGTVLGMIVPHDACVAWAAVDPDDVGAVAPGQRVRMLAAQTPSEVFTGIVRDVAVRAQANRPRTSRGASQATYHVVEVALEDAVDNFGQSNLGQAHLEQANLGQGSYGTASIETDRTTLGRLLQRRLAALFFLRDVRRVDSR